MNESSFKKLYSKYCVFFVLSKLMAFLTSPREFYSAVRHKGGAEKAFCVVRCPAVAASLCPTVVARLLVAHIEGSAPKLHHSVTSVFELRTHLGILRNCVTF